MKGSILALLALIVLCAAPLSGCKADQPAEDPNAVTLMTSVQYQEQLLLPPGCTLTVSLVNVSQLNVGANTVAGTTVTVQAAPPYKVELRYDPLRIDNRLKYGLRARIELNGQLLFASTTRIDPFAAPPGQPIEIPVQKIKH